MCTRVLEPLGKTIPSGFDIGLPIAVFTRCSFFVERVKKTKIERRSEKHPL